jgi:hypothetical protein
MNDSNLTSAKYFQQAEEARAAAVVVNSPEPLPQRRIGTDSLAQVSRWMSWIAGGAVVLCLMVFATGYFAGNGSKKKTYPVDWLLRLGGAQSDQTFEKFVRNAATSKGIDWEEQFKKSPMYQFENSQTPLIDPQKLGWQMNRSSR